LNGSDRWNGSFCCLWGLGFAVDDTGFETLGSATRLVNLAQDLPGASRVRG